MPDSSSPSLNRIGDLLVKEGLLTPDALKTALKHQSELSEYKPLGRVCVDLKLISKMDLQRFLRKHQKSIHLGDILMNMGLITQAQLNHVLEQQKITALRFGTLLVQSEIISEAQLVEALSLQLDLPRIVPAPELVDQHLLEGLDEKFLRTYECLPIHKYENQMVVVMSDPLNGELIQRLIDVFRCKIMPSIATSAEILACISALFDAESTRKNHLHMGNDLLNITHQHHLNEEKVMPIAQFLIRSAVESRATALHVEAQESFLRIRYRVDGVLQHKTDLPSRMGPMLVQCMKTPFRVKREKFWEERIATQIDNTKVELSISFYPGLWGESLVMHISHPKDDFVGLEHLSLSPYSLKRLKGILSRSGGAVIAASPIRGGRTTLLYSFLAYLSQSQRNILTLEESIEHQLPGTIQNRYTPECPDSYEAMIEAMTDYDSDVMMVNQIKNAQVAHRLNAAALVGKKVFSALAAGDSTAALYRLMEMEAKTLLATPVPVAIVAQKLLRKLCLRCRESVPLNVSQLQLLGISPHQSEERRVYEARGCESCNHQGYQGMTALHEIFEIHEMDRKAILQGETASAIREGARRNQRLMSMAEDGLYKAIVGITTIEEVYKTVLLHESDVLTPRSAETIYQICNGQRLLQTV